MDGSDKELEDLLGQKGAAVAENERELFDRLVGSRRLVLMGAGNLGRKLLEPLRRIGMEPLAFADNNPAKQGTAIDGINVLSPAQAAAAWGKSAAFVVTIFSPTHCFPQSKAQLTSLGCDLVLPCPTLLWKMGDPLLPHYLFDLPSRILGQAEKIRHAYGLLSDAESQWLFVDTLRLRLTANFESMPMGTPADQYFPKQVVHLASDEVLVDCGAFDGDTIRTIVDLGLNFKKIVAFEPDPVSYQKLSQYVDGAPKNIGSVVKTVQAAVGSCDCTLRFDASGATSAALSDAGQIAVRCVCLDEYLRDEAVTFLKFDIEGAELDALRGARRLIENGRPTLAVCVYHRPMDLWEIPLYIASLDLGYSFFLRNHGYDGLETVLYAIPPRA